MAPRKPTTYWELVPNVAIAENDDLISRDGMKLTGIEDRDIILYLVWSHYDTSKAKTWMSAAAAAEWLIEAEPTACKRLNRLEAAGLTTRLGGRG